jgi:FKBP-type peptidyl-prolyl cis-trans isomerase (trigger factor)
MSNNKNTKKSYTGAAKTKKVSPPMTKKQIIFTIVASILIVAIVATAVVFIVRAMRGVPVNYMKDNLSKYISLSSDDYKNMSIDVALEEYEEIDLIREINRILAENKSETPEYDGKAYTSEAITLGDVVSIMYRGYYIDKDGKEVEISTNFADGTTVLLEVGSGNIITETGTSGSFISGFTDGMIGVVPSNYEPFKKFGEGKVEAGDVIYLTYTAFYPDSDGTYKQAYAERIDLSEDIDAIYGTGFKAFLLGTAEGAEAQSIGTKLSSKTFPYGNGSAGYSDMKIEYVTRGCESAPLTIDVRFPADYSEQSLRGVDAKFDVYISSSIIYNTPELDEKFITETLKLKAADLEKYTGTDTVAKYKSYLEEGLKKKIDDVNKQVKIDAIWEHLFKKVEVKKLPKYNVDQYYETYFNEVSYYYSMYSSYFKSIDEAAASYLSISQYEDWRSILREKAEKTALEELIFYYIIREEGFLPGKTEFNEMRLSIIEAHYDYHIDLNAEELAKLEGDAYNARVAEIKAEVIEYYGEDYFEENVYYNYGMDKIIEKLVVLN